MCRIFGGFLFCTTAGFPSTYITYAPSFIIIFDFSIFSTSLKRAPRSFADGRDSNRLSLYRLHCVYNSCLRIKFNSRIKCTGTQYFSPSVVHQNPWYYDSDLSSRKIMRAQKKNNACIFITLFTEYLYIFIDDLYIWPSVYTVESSSSFIDRKYLINHYTFNIFYNKIMYFLKIEMHTFFFFEIKLHEIILLYILTL